MRTGTAPPPTGGSFSPNAPFVQPAPPKGRRQPALVALGVAMIGVSAAGFVYYNQQVGAKSSVLVLTRDVPYGQKIVAADLTVVQMSLGNGGVKAVSASSKSTVLTESATTQLHAGALLTPADVSAAPGTPSGTSVLVVNLKPELIPAGLASGKQIVLVANGVAIDPSAKATSSPVDQKKVDSAGLAVALGAKAISFKVTVVGITGTKLTLAVTPTDASDIELFADEGRIGVFIPPSDQ
jgi:hypothetical protein